MQFGAIVLATQVLEDPTTIAVGMLVRKGLVDPFLGMLALIVGIVLGDLLLYGIGQPRRRDGGVGPGPASNPDHDDGSIRGVVRSLRVVGDLFASRLLPGARVPMYVAIGAPLEEACGGSSSGSSWRSPSGCRWS